MNREEKVLEIVQSSKVGNISCEEAAIQICLLFDVVGRSEQLKAFLDYCDEAGWIKNVDKHRVIKDYNKSL